MPIITTICTYIYTGNRAHNNNNMCVEYGLVVFVAVLTDHIKIGGHMTSPPSLLLPSSNHFWYFQPLRFGKRDKPRLYSSTRGGGTGDSRCCSAVPTDLDAGNCSINCSNCCSSSCIRLSLSWLARSNSCTCTSRLSTSSCCLNGATMSPSCFERVRASWN